MAVLLLFVAAVDAVVERHVGAHVVVAAHGCAVERQVYAAEKIPCACKVADGEFGVRRIVVVSSVFGNKIPRIGVAASSFAAIPSEKI